MEIKYLTQKERVHHIRWLGILLLINIVCSNLLLTLDEMMVDPNVFVGISALVILVSCFVYMCYFAFFSVLLFYSQWRDLKNGKDGIKEP